MKARINRNFLEQTSFDSGMPSGLGIVVHRFEEVGEYEIAVLRNDRDAARLSLVVAGERPPEEAGRRAPSAAQEVELAPSQVNIELGQARRAALARPLGELEGPYIVRPGGYVSFTAARQEDASAVVVRRRRKDDREELFDSRRLAQDDIFSVTMVRPGTYSLENAVTGAEGKITVAYPTRGKEPYRPPDPISVESTDDGFSISSIDLMPAQGIIFRMSTPSRIYIDLVEPDDGPQGPRPPKIAGWRKRPDQQVATEPDDKTSQSA